MFPSCLILGGSTVYASPVASAMSWLEELSSPDSTVGSAGYGQNYFVTEQVSYLICASERLGVKIIATSGLCVWQIQVWCLGFSTAET